VCIPNIFTACELIQVIESRPNLSILSISDEGSPCFSGLVLERIAEKALNLSHLTLQIDFSPFLTRITWPPKRPFRCKLRETDIPIAKNLPKDAEEQIATVCNFLVFLKKIRHDAAISRVRYLHEVHIDRPFDEKDPPLNVYIDFWTRFGLHVLKTCSAGLTC
jgi:hypothetical protein